MRIGVIGLGKLGICLAVLFAKCFKVYGVDINEQRIRQIQNREKFYEPQVNEYLDRYGHNLTVSTDYNILRNCDVVFIITQTPSLPNGKFDLQYVESALKQLHKVNPNCLAVISSTINIGDMEKLRGIHNKIVYNPDFIRQGSIIHDFLNPKYVLIGAYTEEDADQVISIWRKLHDKPIYVVKPIEAEIIKLSANVSFTLGITFANIIGELCEKFNADSNKILDIIYQDRRNYKAGLGFGGICFPRDVNCFKAIALENTVESAYRFADLLNQLNKYFAERQVQKIKSLGKKRIGFLGIAYKPNVPYVTESQALKIAQKLLEQGYEIHIYDSLAEKEARQVIPEAHFHPTIEDCIKNSDVIFIGTSNYANIKTDKPVINPWK